MRNNKYVILIADDSEMDVALLEEGIATEERELVCVYSGKETLKYVDHTFPDLILLDVMMPDMNGYEVCEKIKQDPCTKHIPIIFLTSLTDTSDIAKGLEMGAIDYIVKPYNLIEINARIKNHLAMQKGHRRSIELLKGFASSVSDTAIMSNEAGEIMEVFGNYIHYFPKIDIKKGRQKLVDILPESLHKQFSIAMETAYRTKEIFEFETEILINEEKIILQITVSPINNAEIVSIKMSDVTKRRSAERKVDLTYEYQKRSRFFNNVLSGGYTEEQQNQLLSVYGIENQKPLICYVISTSVSDVDMLNIANLRAGIGEWLIEKGHGWIWSSNLGIGMLMQYPSSLGEIEKIAALLKEGLEMRFPNISVHIGVASTEISGMNFKRLYYDALGALMMAVDENREYAVARYGRTGLYELLVHAIEHMDIDRFIDQVLGKIKQNDLKNGSDLLGTLEQLIKVPSIKVVAANLFIHPNTVLWRKQKIEEILETSLDDMDTRTQINLALKFVHIRSFTKKNEDIFVRVQN